MKRKKSLLEKIYERDPASRAFIIKVSIGKYNDIFNDLDPAPFRIRDMDPGLRIYIEESSMDIPPKNDVILQFNAPRDIQDEEKEEKVIMGLNTYFQFIIRSFGREIAGAYKKSLVYILTSFIFLLSAFYLGSVIPADFPFEIMVEGLFIGGWVFLWEAIALFVFKKRDINLQLRRYERLKEAPIKFDYQ